MNIVPNDQPAPDIKHELRKLISWTKDDSPFELVLLAYLRDLLHDSKTSIDESYGDDP